MSSILTNMSAMSAVANLNATQKSLAETQNQISSGLKIASAKDNAAYYSIATNMRTNIGNLSAVSDSLNLGTSVVSTATAATTNITSILQTISSDLVSASQPGTDLDSIQTKLDALRSQLSNSVATASFNGVNLLDGSNAANPQVKFVAGVTGLGANTTVNTLTVDTTSTNFQGASYGGDNALITAKATTATALATATTNKATATAANTAAQTALTTATTANTNALKDLTDAITAASSTDIKDATSTAFKALFGDGASVANGVISDIKTGSLAAKLIGADGTMTVGKAKTTADSTLVYSTGTSAGGTLGALYGASKSNTATSGDAASADGKATAANTALTTATTAFNTAKTADTAALTAINADATASKVFNGALFSISQITLTSGSADGSTPKTSSAQIANFIKQVGAALTAVNNASLTLGAASKNIDLQSTYTSALKDSLTTGVGSLVDADMNEASTRLNALQTQQQLGVQSLSIANQNSQLILKLFQ